MGFDLQIYNPSDYTRDGFVTIPWEIVSERTGIQPQELVVYGTSEETPLIAQVDDLDPNNPKLKTLVFRLEQGVPPGPDDYSSPSASVTIDRGAQQEQVGPQLEVERTADNHVLAAALNNGWLRVVFSPSPSPASNLGTWYSGSTPSVLLDGQEMLDLFRAPFPQFHDLEKRCMQIDQLQVLNPAWEQLPYKQISLFGKPYELISECVGPVRASITVASEPFEYDFTDLYTNNKRGLVCRLYRVISLYINADYVIEELFVKAQPDQNTEAVNLNFTARYFTYMDLGFIPELYRFPDIPDWFALGQPGGNLYEPHPGYGFATDVHTGLITTPHPGFPDIEKSYKSFSWELMPAREAKCLHLFMQGEPGGFDSRIGHYWYEHIYKPLRAGFDDVA